MTRVIVDTTCPYSTETVSGEQRILIRLGALKSTIVSRGAYCERGAGKRSRDPTITRQIISPLAGSVIRFCLPRGVKKDWSIAVFPLLFVVCAMKKRKEKEKKGETGFTI